MSILGNLEKLAIPAESSIRESNKKTFREAAKARPLGFASSCQNPEYLKPDYSPSYGTDQQKMANHFTDCIININQNSKNEPKKGDKSSYLPRNPNRNLQDETNLLNAYNQNINAKRNYNKNMEEMVFAQQLNLEFERICQYHPTPLPKNFEIPINIDVSMFPKDLVANADHLATCLKHNFYGIFLAQFAIIHSALCNRFKVTIDDLWTEKLSLYLILACVSASKKSAVINALKKFLLKFEKQLQDAFNLNFANSNVELEKGAIKKVQNNLQNKKAKIILEGSENDAVEDFSDKLQRFTQAKKELNKAQTILAFSQEAPQKPSFVKLWLNKEATSTLLKLKQGS